MKQKRNEINLLLFDNLVISHIISFLNPFEVTNLELVNKQLYLIIKDMWEYIIKNILCIKHLTYKYYSNMTLKEICLLSWNIYTKNHGIFLQIGGLDNHGNITTYKDEFLSYNDNSIETFDEINHLMYNQLICAPAITTDSYERPLSFGGWLGLDGECTLECLFFSNGDWFQFSQLSRPICFSAASRNTFGSILLCGGCDTPWRGSNVFSEVELYEIPYVLDELITPRKLSPLLNPRCGHGCVTIFNGNTYSIGGYGGDMTYYSSGEFYDYEKNKWYSIQSMSECRSGAGYDLGWDGCIYSAGGSCDGLLGSNTIERYDPRMNKWSLLPTTMKEKRGYVGASFDSSGTILHIAGGIDNDSLKNSIEWYDIRMNKGGYIVENSNEDDINNQRAFYGMIHIYPEIMKYNELRYNIIQV